jgi:hypothetical protein
MAVMAVYNNIGTSISSLLGGSIHTDTMYVHIMDHASQVVLFLSTISNQQQKLFDE